MGDRIRPPYRPEQSAVIESSRFHDLGATGMMLTDVSRSARAPATNYLCSLGTNTVLGKVRNGLLALLLDGGAEN